MITQVRGVLVNKTPTFAVLEVGGSAGGVGYGVAISLATYDQLPDVGEEITLLTHHYVREDRQELFGFAEERERSVFVQLIGISGIGPTSAQTILSGMSVDALEEAIFFERLGELTTIKGIGRKTAERMVVELKDKIQPSAVTASSAKTPHEDKTDGIVDEAILALKALGFSSQAAFQSVAKAAKNGGAKQTVQELIKNALKER